MSSMAAILLYTVVPGALYESLGNVFCWCLVTINYQYNQI